MTDPSRDSFMPQVTGEVLKDVGLFNDVSEESLNRLAQELPCIKVELGKKVVQEGDESQLMYIVLGGELEVTKKRPDGHSVTVALLGPGDWFGEMSLLETFPRSATVRALAPSMLMVMTWDHVQTLLAAQDMEAYATLLLNISRELSRRLRVADGLVAQFVSTVSGVYAPAPRKK